MGESLLSGTEQSATPTPRTLKVRITSLFCAGLTTYTGHPEQLKAAIHSIDILLVAGLGKTVDWNELVSLVANYGTFVLLALPESLVAINPAGLIFRQVNVTGSLTGGRRTLLEMLDFAAKHNVRPWIEKREMNDINEMVKYVMEGGPRYRAVMEMEAASKI